MDWKTIKFFISFIFAGFQLRNRDQILKEKTK